MKRVISVTIAVFIFIVSCSCLPVDISSLLPSTEAPAGETETPETTEEPAVKPHFTVNFDKNETFESDAAREASAIIDNSICAAVDGLNDAIKNNILPDCEIISGAPRTLYREKLEGLELKFYDEIKEAMTSFRDFSYSPRDYGFTNPIDSTFASAILTARNSLYWDDTRLFMYADIDSVGFDQVSCYYMPNEWLEECKDKDAVRHAVDVFDAVCRRILGKMPDGMTNTMKVYYFTRVIADFASYDYSNESIYAMFQPYECLVRGKCVCQGYARALQYLCRLSGIECGCAEGQAPGGGDHMWNCVETSDGQYFIDVTWADTESGFINGYFMMDYAALTEYEGYVIESFAEY